MPMYTWTAAPTYTPFPTQTPIPVTQLYMTPPGGWGTPDLPTFEPLNTVEPLIGFTPDATHDSKIHAVETLVMDAQLMYSAVITFAAWAESYSVDPSTYITSGNSTGTITNPTFYLSKLTLPIGYVKGVVRFLPHIGPLIIFILGAFMFMIAVRIIKPLYILIMWVIRQIERVWEAIPFN